MVFTWKILQCSFKTNFWCSYEYCLRCVLHHTRLNSPERDASCSIIVTIWLCCYIHTLVAVRVSPKRRVPVLITQRENTLYIIRGKQSFSKHVLRYNLRLHLCLCACVCVWCCVEREREKRYKNNNNDDEKLSAHSIDLTRMEVQGAHSERRRDTVEGDIFSSYSRYPSDPTSLGDLGYLASVTLPPGRKAVKS